MSDLRAWTHSLRFRLTLWYTGVLAVILVLAAVLVFLGARRTLQAEADQFLAGEAHRLAAVAAGRPGDMGDTTDLAEALTLTRPVRDAPRSLLFDVVYARVVKNARGDTLAASADLANKPALIAALNPLLRRRLPLSGNFSFAGPDEEQVMRVFTAPVRLSSGAGLVQVAIPWDQSADLLERLSALLLVGVPLVLLLAGLGGWVLVGRTLQPISRIVAEAEHLDAADLPEALLPEAAETDSEIGRLVATLNGMTTRLRRAFDVQRRFLEAQQRFAADASHELRTPLTILRGEMELALARPRTMETYRATLASAVEETARMSRIVESLSFLARRDAGRMENEAAFSLVDLQALGRTTVAEFASQAGERQVRLQFEGGASSVCVRGSADQLQQLLRNLVDNALKYTPAGGQVTVAAGLTNGRADESRWAALTVRDTGVGIAAADLPHIFDRFWRADRSRASEGSGLGLAICAEIAALHGGTLTATSDLGQGSCFHLCLEATGRDEPGPPRP